VLHFLGIGAQKAGTTWLYEHLKAHPQVRFPADKELHFWDLPAGRDLDWYRAQFPDYPDSSLRNGEITPAYAVIGPKRIAEVYEAFPSIRLVYLLRNPMDRAWSSALMALEMAGMRIDEASDQWFIDHFNSEGSLRRGDYETCLRNWEGVYPRAQILVMRYEGIAQQPRTLLKRVAAHFEIDIGFFENLPEERLKRRVFAGRGHPLRATLEPVLTRLYGDRVRSLSDYLGMDLSGWMSPSRAAE
jgi:hypothetical protein